MISLIIKDLKANQSPVMSFMLGNLVFAAIVFYFWTYDVFILHGIGIISVSIARLSALEQQNRKEMLWASMPVKRIQIVLSRYLSSFVIVTAGMMLWLSAAVIFNRIFPAAVTDFTQLANFINLLIPVFLVTVYIALFLPTFFKFDTYKALFTFAIVILIVMATMGIALQRAFRSNDTDIYNIINRMGFESVTVFTGLLMAAVTGLSVLVSIWFYNKRNL